IALAIAPLLTTGPFGALERLQVGTEAGRRVMEVVADSVEQFGFRPLLHHMDDCLFPRRLTGEPRVAVQIIEIFGDGGGFGDVSAVIDLFFRQKTAYDLAT